MEKKDGMEKSVELFHKHSKSKEKSDAKARHTRGMGNGETRGAQ